MLLIGTSSAGVVGWAITPMWCSSTKPLIRGQKSGNGPEGPISAVSGLFRRLWPLIRHYVVWAGSRGVLRRGAPGSRNPWSEHEEQCHGKGAPERFP